MKVAVLYIATGQYSLFLEEFYTTAQQHLFRGVEKHYFVWTDADVQDSDDVTVTKVQHERWPLVALKKSEFFLMRREELLQYDRCYYFNANSYFVQDVTPEFLGLEDSHPLVCCQHPCSVNIRQSTEHNPKSNGYIADLKYTYVMGGFQGGNPKEFLDMCEVIKKWTDEDLKNHTVPVYHDESYLNRFILQDKSVWCVLPRKTFCTPPKAIKQRQQAVIVLKEKRHFFKFDEYRIKSPTGMIYD